MLLDQIDLISIGRHTRLGDVLEHALEGLTFETLDTEALSNGSLLHRRLLFVVSADQYGENEQMHAMNSLFLRGECRLDGSACAVIADGEQGGALYTDALRLLRAANRAGAACVAQPLLASSRDLRSLPASSVGGRKTPFARYCALAKALVKRLSEYEGESGEMMRVRLATALSSGAAREWGIALARLLEPVKCDLTDTSTAKHTILLAENTTGLPDEKTLALLKNRGGCLRCLIASPAMGGDLYALALLDQACARGGYALSPEGMLVFEGMSAVEALSSGAELERVKAFFRG